MRRRSYIIGRGVGVVGLGSLLAFIDPTVRVRAIVCTVLAVVIIVAFAYLSPHDDA